MQKNRSLVDIIQRRLAEPTPLIQVVVGPRQVGKTTALQAALDGRGVYRSADHPVPLQSRIVSDWWQKPNTLRSVFVMRSKKLNGQNAVG